MAVRYTSHQFIGREAEFGLLVTMLEAVAEGRPSTVLVGGTSGMGASRFLAEASGRVASLGDPIAVVRGRARPDGVEPPYEPIRSAIRPVLDAASDRELARLVGPAGDEIGRLIPSVAGRLRDLGLISARPTVTDPERRQSRVLESILGLLTRFGERRPVVLILEDLHEADAATRTMAMFLARITRPRRVGLIVTCKPDEISSRHPSQADLATILALPSGVSRIDLPPLSRDELADLVAGIEGERPSASALLLVAERSNGNPLVAEELIAARRELSRASLTGTLDDIVVARLDLRSSDCRRVVRLLASAGRPVSETELAAISAAYEPDAVDRPRRSVPPGRRAAAGLEPQLAAGLEEALASGIVVRSDDDASGVAGAGSHISIRHERLARAIFDDIRPLQRPRYHMALAHGLRGSPAGRARHWLAAHLPGPARTAAIEAASEAERMAAPEDAIRHLELALELSRAAQAAEAADAVAIIDAARSGLAADGRIGAVSAAAVVSVPQASIADLKQRVAEAYFAARRPARAVAFVQAAIRRLDERTDRARIALLHERLGRYRRAAGDQEGSITAHRRAVELVAPGPSVDRAVVLAALAQVLMLEGTFSEAERYAREAIAVAESVGDAARAEAVHATTTLGVVAGWGGEPERAVELLIRARDDATERRFLDEAFRATANLTTVLDLLGRREEAVEMAFEGIEAAREQGQEAVYGNFLRGNAADSLFLLGRWVESRELSNRALEWSPSGSSFVNAVLNLAIVEIESSAGETAGRLLGQVLVELETVRDVQYVVPAHQAAAALAAWSGDLADARRAVERGWESVSGTEDWVLAAKMAASVATIDAASAAEARQRRDLATVAASRERTANVVAEAERMVRVSNVAPSAGSRREAEAYLQTARAHRARLEARNDPVIWAELATTWSRLGDRYQVARSRWRQAEASLESGEGRLGRAAARAPLLEAVAIASDLGSAPLLGELRALARRALIALPEPTQPDRAPLGIPIEIAAFDGVSAVRGQPDGVPAEALSVAELVGAGGDGRRSVASLASTDPASLLGRPGAVPLHLENGFEDPGPDIDLASLVRGILNEPRPRRPDSFGLSPREKEVLGLIALGRTNREIGERLFISQKTVGVHVGNILSKLRVSGRVEAAAVAIRLGLAVGA